MLIYWSAKNNNSFLNGHRTAKSMRAAVHDARYYVLNELYGEGIITYWSDIDAPPIRVDEKSIFTGQRWVAREV